MTSEVHTLLTARDRALYSNARADLRRRIRAAKLAYKGKIEDSVSANDPRRVWQGLQHLTNYKGSQKAVTTTNGAVLAEDLNNFFARFETSSSSTPLPLVTDIPALTIQQHEVRQVLKVVKPRKAAQMGYLGRYSGHAATNSLLSLPSSSIYLSLRPLSPLP